MNIVYSSSDSYAEICGISLLSLYENNKDINEIVTYIIDNDISPENKANLKKIAKDYNRKIIFKKKFDIEKVSRTKINVGRWNIGTFFRLFLGKILPQSVERVMYFDCDMIIRHSLKDIYNLDIGECIVAGADDCRSDNYRKEIGLSHGDTYINNGFLLINLKKWRSLDLDDDFIKYISLHKGDITYMDQGVLNAVLGKKKLVYEIPPKYNAQRIFFDFSYKEILKLRKPEYHCSEQEYNEAVNDPIIVHFTPTFITGTRPWNIKDNHKFTPEYLKYKSMSPWKDVPKRKDDRKKAKKLMTCICRMTPKPIMIKVMSYLHSSWYPKKRMRKASKE